MKLQSALRCLGNAPSLLLLWVLLLPIENARAQYVLEHSFNKPLPMINDRFGYSVAIEGDHVLIGAPEATDDDSGAVRAGSVFLFNRQTGALVGTFSNPTPQANDLFGWAVAIDGNNVLIGAPQNRIGGIDAGGAYLFDVRNGDLLRTFFSPTPDLRDFFGWSVAISGDQLVIGEPSDDTGTTNSGSAYLFDTSGSLLAAIPNPVASDDLFGSSVAITADYIVAGAPFGRSSLGDPSGVAYLFNASGALVEAFVNPSPGDGDNFGHSVAIDAERIVIGALGDDSSSLNAGIAYLFGSSSGAPLQTFFNPFPTLDDQFGSSVDIDGHNVLIGAQYADDLISDTAGAAYLFDVSGVLVQVFGNPATGDFDLFGQSVAIDNANVLIGSPVETSQVDRIGSAYLYGLRSTTAVPSPLPLFGMAGAFCWSRRLRRRLSRAGA